MVIEISLLEIFKSIIIDCVFEIILLYESLTFLGEPVDPDVVCNNKSSSSIFFPMIEWF